MEGDKLELLRVCKAQVEDAKTVAQLLKRTPVDVKDKDEKTALHWAAISGHTRTVPLLISAGYTIDARDAQKGRTPLSYAATFARRSIVKDLLSAGALTDVTTRQGVPLFHEVCAAGNLDMVKLFIGSNVDVGALDQSSGNNALLASLDRSTNCNAAVVRLLLDMGCLVTHVDHEKRTALHLAAATGITSVVDLLLESGVDRDALDADGRSCLHEAVLHDQLEMTKLLLERQFDVNQLSKRGESGLILANTPGSERIMQLLLEWGADYRVALEDSKENALHIAVKSNRASIVRLLLDHASKHEADGAVEFCNAAAADGKTALLFACEQGSTEIVDLLLDAGANVAASDRKNNTAISIAAQRGYFDVVKQLVSAGARDVQHFRKVLWQCCSNKDADAGLVRMLLQNVNNVDEYSSPEGESCLQAAVKVGNQEIVRLLLEHHANPHKQFNGKSALDIAYTFRNYFVAEMIENFAKTHAGRQTKPARLARSLPHLEVIS